MHQEKVPAPEFLNVKCPSIFNVDGVKFKKLGPLKSHIPLA